MSSILELELYTVKIYLFVYLFVYLFIYLFINPHQGNATTKTQLETTKTAVWNK